MDLLIKLIILLLISSCTTFNLSDIKIPIFLKESSDNYDNIINNLENNNVYLIVKNFNSEDIIFVQINKNETSSFWTSNDDIKLVTHKGKVLSSLGLQNNLSILIPKDSFNNLYQNNETIEAFIKFTNPSTEYLPIKYSYKVLDSQRTLSNSKTNTNYRIIEETFDVPLIRWRGVNVYWIDSKGAIIKSKQSLYPNEDNLNYELIKK